MTEFYNKFYINGEWVEPAGRDRLDVINPSTEEVFASISMGTAEDVNTAATAARVAFPGWSISSVDERVAVLEKRLYSGFIVIVRINPEIGFWQAKLLCRSLQANIDTQMCHAWLNPLQQMIVTSLGDGLCR